MPSNAEIVVGERHMPGTPLDETVKDEAARLAAAGWNFQINDSTPHQGYPVTVIQLLTNKTTVPIENGWAVVPEGYRAFQMSNDPIKPEKHYDLKE